MVSLNRLSEIKSLLPKIDTRFGGVVVIGYHETKISQVKCLCDCGKICYIRYTWLLSGKIFSCGCYKKNRAIKNLKVGQKFNNLTIIDLHFGKNEYNQTLVRCQCDCGKIYDITPASLKRWRSCRCANRIKTNIGDKFGALTVIDNSFVGKNRLVKFRCDCGKEVYKEFYRVRKGSTKTCGCRIVVYTSEQDALKYSFEHYRDRNLRERNFEWQLTLDEYSNLIKSNCYYCGDPPNIQTVHKILIRNGIDRIDNNKGYVLDNCVTSCFKCNKMKYSLHKDVFLDKLTKIYNLRVKK